MGTHEISCQELPYSWFDYLDGYPNFLRRLEFTSRNLLDSAAGGTFMSTTLGAATKLLDDMMTNYSQWHTERAPIGRKVNSVEEISSLNEKADLIMSLLSKQSSIDPRDDPLNSLIAQAYRSNFGSNPRSFPSNSYGNNNAYLSTKNSTQKDRDLPGYEKL